MWLDFSEIPPAKLPSNDTEAFEKFAKQFFEELYQGEIEKTAGRGADGGVDIIVKIGKEKWLISCKHYLASSVSAASEEDPKGRIDMHGCHKFIGFYSCTPNNSLNGKLAGIRLNHSSFQFEILNDKDIEAKLFSSQNAKGWLLAARWFPLSYSKLFSQLVHPINHFDENHITINEHEGKLWAGNIPLAVHFASNDKNALHQAKKDALFIANEFATSQAFDRIFFERISELAALFPGTFTKTRFIDEEKQSTKTIFPSWRFETLSNLILTSNISLKGIYAICTAWSFWDATAAATHIRAARMLYSVRSQFEINDSVSAEDVILHYEQEHGADSAATSHSDSIFQLTLGEIGANYSTLARGYFASLLCFCPLGLKPQYDKNKAAVWLAKHFNEEEILRDRLENIVLEFKESDQHYVRSHPNDLLNLLIDVRYIDCLDKKYTARIQDSLRCFTESITEPWTPSARISKDLADIFKNEY